MPAQFGQEWSAGGGVVDAGGGDGHGRPGSCCPFTGGMRSAVLDKLPVDDHTFDPNDEILGG
ncbi:hypothetical protein ACFFTQ_29150 [Streptomyces roseofulvus]|uniref:hypothetical protein n=1 Tax=Streptomyces roseofulvus TaxID=33902 RepID=UPI0031F91350